MKRGNSMPVLSFKNTFVRPSVDIPFYDEEKELHGDLEKGLEQKGFVDYVNVSMSDDGLTRTYTRYTFIESASIGQVIMLSYRMSPEWYDFFISKHEYNSLHNIQQLPIKLEFYDSDLSSTIHEYEVPITDIF
jgi:hypothetical protein